NIQIRQPAQLRYQALTFSRDGNYIYYVASEKGQSSSTLYQIPALGDDPRKLIVGVDSPVTLSPDGRRLAFVRSAPPESVLIIANADGTEEKKLAARHRPESFWKPAWSPDGRAIACSAMSFSPTENDSYMNVVEVRVEDGTVRPITSEKWSRVEQLAWLRDGSGL